MLVMCTPNWHAIGDRGVGLSDLDRQEHFDQPFLVVASATIDDYRAFLAEKAVELTLIDEILLQQPQFFYFVAID